jgi:hypothetical protein
VASPSPGGSDPYAGPPVGLSLPPTGSLKQTWRKAQGTSESSQIDGMGRGGSVDIFRVFVLTFTFRRPLMKRVAILV